MEGNAKRVAGEVTAVSIGVNLLLAVVRLLVGIAAKSGAMISDAIHAASDVFSAVIVLFGVYLADRQSDKEHPYGHERMECVAAILLATILALTGGSLGLNAVRDIVSGRWKQLPVPEVSALVVALGCIGIKEGLFWYVRGRAKQIRSDTMLAEAWHHRADALSSIGVLLGIVAARLGFPMGDCLASLIICCVIVKVAYGIFKDAVGKMLDTSCGDVLEGELRACAMAQEGILGVHSIRTRAFGNRVFVDMEIHADGNATSFQTHAIAEQVHNAIEADFPSVKHIMIHVEPLGIAKIN